ncbi:MAG: hypothetical protein AB1755_03050 [Candidatus Omnitrophota bacterium]
MDWRTTLLEPIQGMLGLIGVFISKLFIVIVILFIGWILAKLIKTIVERALKILKVELLTKRLGVEDFISKGGIKHNFSELIGMLAYWLTILVVVVAAVNAIGLTVAADLLNKIVLYIPNVIAAIFILALGMFGATFLSSLVVTTANNAGIEQSKLLGKIVDVIVIIFAIAIALEQLRIGTIVIALTINIIVAAIGLAFALAFGLGCKDMAGKYLSDVVDKVKSKR